MVVRDLEFWFEFGSTYSHVAACRAVDLVRDAGVRLRWRPFLLGPIFKEQGWNDSPFNLYPAKGAYMWRDMERQCEKYGIPFRRPTRFPRNGLLATRVALLGEREPWCADFVRAIYLANFAEDRDIASPDTVAALLRKAGVEEAHAVMESAETPENKARLRERTEEARRLGIFGAPTFRVGDELFWGNDRFEDALAWCARKVAQAP